MRFSIIIPSADVDELLVRALRSLKAQRFTDFEVVVGWNSQNDPQKSNLWALARQSVANILWIRSEPGTGAGRNAAIAAAKGEYLVFLDADDELQPGALMVLDSTLRNHPEVDVIHYSAHDRRAVGRLAQPSWYLSLGRIAYSGLPLGEPIEIARPVPGHFHLVSPAPWLRCVRRSLVEEAGLVFQNTTNLNDLHFFITLMASPHKALFLDRRLVIYSREGRNSATSRRTETLSNLLNSLRSSNAWLAKESHRRVFKHELDAFAMSQILGLWSLMPLGPKFYLWSIISVRGFFTTLVGNKNLAIAFTMLSCGLPHTFASKLSSLIRRTPKT